MPRPKCLRRIRHVPGVTYFKPAGAPLLALEEIVVPLDEVEAIRLADFEGVYHEEAAGRMRISRPTFSRLLESARRKIADALLHGKAIRMEGGPVAMEGGCETRPGGGEPAGGRGRAGGRRPRTGGRGAADGIRDGNESA